MRLSGRYRVIVPVAATLALVLALPAADAGPLRLTGEARMGLVRDAGPRDTTSHDSSARDTGPRWRLERDIELRLIADGVTDGGLRFGAVLDLDRYRRR